MINNFGFSFKQAVDYKWMVLFVCWLCGAFAGLNSSLFSVILPQAVSELTSHTEKTIVVQYGSYALSLFLAGWMLGGIFLGFVNDRLGRVRTLALSVAIYSIATACGGMSQSMLQLLTSRFVTGLGVGGTMVGISVILAETWPASSRSVAMGALVTSYQGGVFLAGLFVHIAPDWRYAFASGAIPVALSLFIVRWFNEPVAIKKSEGVASAPEKNIFRNRLLGTVIFGSLLIGYWASLAWIPTWIHELKESPLDAKTVATMINGLGAVIGCMLAGPLADRWGRRMIIFVSYSGAFLVSWWLFGRPLVFDGSVYGCCGLLGVFIGMAQGVMYIYLPELFPAATRGASVGICLNLGRIFTCIAVIFMGALVEFFGSYAGALYSFSIFYLAGTFFVLFAVETKERLPVLS
jgi:MFS family permease